MFYVKSYYPSKFKVKNKTIINNYIIPLSKYNLEIFDKMNYENMVKLVTQYTKFSKQYLAKKSNIDNLKSDVIWFICFWCILIKHKFRLRTKDIHYLTKKRQYCIKWIFSFRRVNQYPNRQFNQISCHIWVKLSKNATTRNQLKRAIMNYIRDKNISDTPLNWQFYKIFVNLDKNSLPQLVNYIESHDKSERNWFFQKEFESAFISFQSSLCSKN